MIQVYHKDELGAYRSNRANRIDKLRKSTKENEVEMKSLRIKIPLTLYVETKVYSCQTIKSVSQVIELALEEYLNK